MILSIAVYTSLALVLFGLSWHVNLREQRLILSDGQRLPFFTWEIMLSIIVFMLVAGARYHTGYDHAMYLHQYISYGKYGFFTRDFEPLFMWITQLMARAHVHYFFYFALWAALQFLFCLLSCRHNKKLLPWLCLNIVLGPFWLYLMNSMREAVVASLFLAVLPLIVQRRFWLYAVIAILASGIHNSSLLMIPIYFMGFINVKPSNKVIIGLLIVLVCAIVIGLNPMWLKLILRVLVSFDCIGDQYMSIVNPMINGQFRTSNWGVISVLTLAMNVMAICLYPKLHSYFSNNKILPLIFVLFITYCIFYYAFVNTHHLFLRPFDLLMLSKLLIYSYVVLYLFENRKWPLLLVFSSFNFSIVYLSIIKAIAIPNQVNQQILYHFFFA